MLFTKKNDTDFFYCCSLRLLKTRCRPLKFSEPP